MYTLWKSYFHEIYHDTNLKKELYWTHFYISLICSQIIEILKSHLEIPIVAFSNLFSLHKRLYTQFFDLKSNEESKNFTQSLKGR